MTEPIQVSATPNDPNTSTTVTATPDPVTVQPGQVDANGVPVGFKPGNQVNQAVNQAVLPPAASLAPPDGGDMQHTGLFHKILTRMNQGDMQVVRDRNGNPVPDPQTGRVKTQALTSKQLGRSILAGVLSAMAATETHQPYRNGNGEWVNPSNEAVAAAQQKWASTRPNAQLQAATEQSNKQRIQQYATYEANLKMLTQAQSLYTLQSEQMAKAVDYYKDLNEQFNQGVIEGPDGENLYDPTFASMTPDEMEAHIKKGDFTRELAWPSSVEPILDPQTHLPTGRSQVRWSAIKGPADIQVSDKMRAEYPQLKNAPNTIPLLQYLKLARTSADYSTLGSMFQKVADAQVTAKMPGAKEITFDWKQFQKDARLTPDQIHQLHGLSQIANDPGKFIEAITKMDQANAGGGRIGEAMAKQGLSIDADAWKAKEQEDEAKVKAENNRAARQDDLQNGKLDENLARTITSAPTTVTAARLAQAKKFLEDQQSGKIAVASAEAKGRVAAEADVPDMQDTARNIVSGDLGRIRDYTSMRGSQKMALNKAIHDEAVAQGKDPQDYSPEAMETKANVWEAYHNPEKKQGQNIQSFDIFLNHANDAMDANDKMRSKMVTSGLRQVPMVNQPLDWLDKHVSGDRDYQSFIDALEPVRKEFESFLNNNRAEHTEDIQNMMKILNDNKMSPAQIEASLKQLGKSADIRLAGMARKYQDTMHQVYPGILTQESAAVLKRMGIDSATVKSMQNYKTPAPTRVYQQQYPDIMGNDHTMWHFDPTQRQYINTVTGQPYKPQ